MWPIVKHISSPIFFAWYLKQHRQKNLIATIRALGLSCRNRTIVAAKSAKGSLINTLKDIAIKEGGERRVSRTAFRITLLGEAKLFIAVGELKAEGGHEYIEHLRCITSYFRQYHWTRQADQNVVNDEHVYREWAREPRFSVCDESGLELSGDIQAAIWPLACRSSYQGYHRELGPFAMSAQAVQFVVHPVHEVRSIVDENCQGAGANRFTEWVFDERKKTWG